MFLLYSPHLFILFQIIHYYLVNDTVEIREVHTANDGRDPFPVLVCRQRLPKDRTNVECKYIVCNCSSESYIHLFSWVWIQARQTLSLRVSYLNKDRLTTCGIANLWTFRSHFIMSYLKKVNAFLVYAFMKLLLINGVYIKAFGKLKMA